MSKMDHDSIRPHLSFRPYILFKDGSRQIYFIALLESFVYLSIELLITWQGNPHSPK